jgi:two-component system cell cycle sensor histidine kinase/response regulator CckA
VMLAVSDTGSGMDEETRLHIFEPFFTTKARGKGMGMGLSIVYGIVAQSGGDIRVDTEPGRGASFKIYLPCVDEGTTVTSTDHTSQHPLSVSETILLAEDEDVVRGMVREVLKMHGYKVLEAANGCEALQICKRHTGPIHLLLTDVVMPQMGGSELAQHVATMRPGTRVLFMSGFTDDAIVRHGILDAGLAFIQKPFTPDALARKVRELIGVPTRGSDDHALTNEHEAPSQFAEVPDNPCDTIH